MTEMQRKLTPSKFYVHLENWLAVAKMETGGFSSKMYVLYHNPWNMRPATVRQTTQQSSVTLGNNGQFATYGNLSDAVTDILLYMNAREFPTRPMSLLSFVQFLKEKNYYGTESVSSYYAKVDAWMDR
jgi:hypothetical protein